MPSHVVITCTCGTKEPIGCEVPGHGVIPLEVDPWALVSAGEEAVGHLLQAEQSLIAARAAWVSRGLPGDNQFPIGLDRETMRLVVSIHNLRKWVSGARTVAERRSNG